MIFEDINKCDVFGELIRDLVFNTKSDMDFGAVSCFDTRHDFAPLTNKGGKSLYRNMEHLLCGDILNDPYVTSNYWAEEHGIINEELNSAMYVSNGKLHAAWYSDGDTVLLVGSTLKNGSIRWAINTDAKKSGNWDWVAPCVDNDLDEVLATSKLLNKQMFTFFCNRLCISFNPETDNPAQIILEWAKSAKGLSDTNKELVTLYHSMVDCFSKLTALKETND